MPRETLQQESFTAGEIDPLLAAREDFDDYYRAVDRALNVIAQPTGGMTRRGGLEHIDTIPTSSTYWKNNGENVFQLIDFAAREDETYMGVLTHDGTDPILKFYRKDTFVTTLNGGDAAVALPYSASEISDIDWAQKLDVLILCHEDYQPREVLRTGTDAFEVNKLSLSDIPQFNFDDSSSPSKENEVQKINFEGMSAGDSYDISLEGEVTQEIKWTSDNAKNATRIEDNLRRLPNTDPSGINVNALAGDDFNVYFESGNGAYDWDNMIVTVFTGSGTASVGVDLEGNSGEENVWSGTRGWPKHATFYQQRLWFAGSKSLPQTVWGSKVGDIFRFKIGEGDPDEAIQATINTDQLSEINWIFAGRNLIVGTEKAEYYVPEEPITPENFRMVASTRRGSKSRIRPVEIDGRVYYVQRGGQALRRYVFSFAEDSYTSKNISLLASHLINDPVSLSLRPSTQTDIADLIFMVNDESGSVASLSLLSSEKVIAFTEFQTVGRFRNTRSINFDNYFMVERDIPEKSPITDDWDSKKNIPTAREQMASAQNNGYIHVIGGSEAGSVVGTYQRYSFEDNEWTTKASLPNKRRRGSADFLDGQLFFGGGKDSNGNDTASFYAKLTDANAWEQKDDMPVATSAHQLVEADGKLFLIAPTATYVYDENQDDWTQKTAMPNERHYFSATSYKKKIYIFGGEDSNNSVTATTQIYDVTNDSWSTGTDMTQKRKHSVAETAIQSSGDEIWVIGGHSGNTQLVTNEAYDISNDSWSSQANMTTSRDSAASGINKLKMHVIGGDNSGDVAVNERYGFLQPVYHLEKLNNDHLLDASERKTSGLGSKTITGFDHLKGETVDVHADGFYKGTKTVNSSGEITLDKKADDYVEVGYDLVTPTVRLLKATIQSGQSTISDRKKRIVEATLQLYKTQGLAVNGNKLSFRNFGDNLLDQQIPAFTGNKNVDGITGWDEEIQLEITQPDPQPMTLLGVMQVVSF